MEKLNEMLNCMKEKTEETFKYYTKKDSWTEQDLKAAKDAAELYDKIQTIQMNTGVWENINRDGEFSTARMPRVSYGYDDRYMHRDRDWDQSYGRHRSYGDGRYMPDPGMSTHSVKDQAIQRLESLMDSAQSDYERQEILKMIKTIEKQER